MADRVSIKMKSGSSLPDGYYPAKILSTSIAPDQPGFEEGQLRDVLVISLAVTAPNGAVLDFQYRPTFVLSPKSNLFKMLDALSMLPGADEDFYIDTLNDKAVTVRIKNETNNNVNYSNIKEVHPLMTAPAAPVAPAPAPTAVTPATVSTVQSVDDEDDADLSYSV